MCKLFIFLQCNTAPKLRLIALLASICCANQALAAACYTPSPYLESQGDAYYDLDETVPLSDADQLKLADFLKTLSGKWYGVLTSMRCMGPDSAPRQLVKSAELSIKAEAMPNQQLRLQAEKHFLEARIRKIERLDLLPNTHFYAIALNRYQLTFSERYRRNINKTSRLTEVLYHIKTNSSNDRWLVNRSYYTNGVLTGSENWSLTR